MTRARAAPAKDADEMTHPLFVRVAHWINALAVILMILSGWRIYDAAPLFGFDIPAGFTLGGWLAGALAWHFAAMWLLGANFLAYLLYGALSGRFRRRLLPLWPGEAWRDLRDILAGRTAHRPGRYTGAQRAAYVFALLSLGLAILSGLAIWKPVQLQELTAAMGGFEAARRVHFFAMAALVVFLVAHVTMALRVKEALRAMTFGATEEDA